MKSVSQICKETGLSRKTLFYYDRIGLLVPHSRNGKLKVKMYSDEDLLRLHEIMKYRRCRVSVHNIRRILDDPSSSEKDILVQNIADLYAESRMITDEISYSKEILNDIRLKNENQL